jgi:hypothetical protein
MTRLLKGKPGGFPVNLCANMLLVWTHLLASVLLLLQAGMILWHFRRDIRTVLLWGGPQSLNVLVWWVLWGRTLSYDDIDAVSASRLYMHWDLMGLYRCWTTSVSGMTGSTLGRGGAVCAASLFLFLLALLALAGRSLRGKAGADEWHLVLFALTPVLCFLFSKWVYPMWQTRYTVYAHMGIVILLVLGCGVLGPFRRIAVCAVVAVFAAQYLSMPVPARTNWKAIARSVPDHRPVYVYPGFQWLAARRYFPNNEIIPVKYCDVEFAATPIHPTGWLVVVGAPPIDRRFEKHFKMSRQASFNSVSKCIRLWKLEAPGYSPPSARLSDKPLTMSGAGAIILPRRNQDGLGGNCARCHDAAAPNHCAEQTGIPSNRSRG